MTGVVNKVMVFVLISQIVGKSAGRDKWLNAVNWQRLCPALQVEILEIESFPEIEHVNKAPLRADEHLVPSKTMTDSAGNSFKRIASDF